MWKEKKKRKFLIVEKERAYLSLSASDMIVNLENPKPSTEKLLELIRALVKLLQGKSMYKNEFCL